ncbi:hypothetical protein ACWEKM_19450 [Streptomyces sp. NPDC004752]
MEDYFEPHRRIADRVQAERARIVDLVDEDLPGEDAIGTEHVPAVAVLAGVEHEADEPEERSGSGHTDQAERPGRQGVDAGEEIIHRRSSAFSHSKSVTETFPPVTGLCRRDPL